MLNYGLVIENIEVSVKYIKMDADNDCEDAM